MNKKDEKGIFLDHHGKKLGGKIVGECTQQSFVSNLDERMSD